MGRKGAKLSGKATAVAEQVVEGLASIGAIASRKMFGGYGIFQDGAMFALVSSEGGIFLKVSDANRSRFETEDAEQFGSMPYYELPSRVLDDEALLIEWARASIEVAHDAKRT